MKLDQVAVSAGLIRKVLLAALIGAGFILVLEPTHTENVPILAAFALWFTHLFLAAALFLTGVLVLQRFRCPDPIPAIASGLVLPIPFALGSLVLDYGFGNADDDLQAAGTPVSVFLNEIVTITPLALAVAVAMTFLLRRSPSDESALQTEGQPKEFSPSLKQLIHSVPSALGDDIIHLHAQDHYVEIVTTEGRALLSEQFGDCLDKLENLNGLQCHRSHWISLEHVDSVSRKGSAYTCKMSNGDLVPVSRRRYAELRDKVDAAFTNARRQ
ncbi:LytTR family DNA-binding domain-containing protein [Roseibium sp. RKSG952]|uniref:LytTR family DNA-binding domain-containing protein n=1 Tax=Roseibium sp. RKSG952 TaxID=2529384 RepID=UPI0012BC5F24|nr:LytTR family DNA-binding domain-containing protein [Roseibium sp. RKSG952]MTI03388.1 response regulator transcription factor [Roseibium sp. RKSG952]